MSANLEINAKDNASKQLERIADSMDKLVKGMNKLTGENDKQEKAFTKISKVYKKFTKDLNPVAKGFEKVAFQSTKLGFIFARGALKAGLGIASRGLSLLGLQALGIAEGFGRLGVKGVQRFAQALSDLVRGSLAAAKRALMDFTKTAFREFTSLDKAGREIAIFAGTVDRSFGNFDENAEVYRKAITGIARQTIFSSGEIAGAMSEIASIGQFETPEQLTFLTETAAALAVATGADMQFAGELLARTMNAFSGVLSDARNASGELLTEQEKMVAVSNVLARAANDSALSMAQLGDAMQYVSPLAVAAGVSLQESVAMVAALSNMGFNASRAGTAIAQALEALTAPSKGAADAMASIDFTAFDDEGRMKDMGTILVELQDRLAQIATDEERLMVMQEMFGTRAGRAMNALMNDTEQYSNLLLSLAEDAEEGFNLIKVANEAMMKSVAGQVSILQGSLEDLRMSIMGALEPLLVNAEGTGILQNLNNLFSNPDIIGTFESLAQSMSNVLQILNNNAETLVTGFGGVFETLINLVGVLVQTFALLFQETENGMSIFGMVTDMFMSIINVLGMVLPLILPAIQRVLAAIMPIFDAVIANFDTFVPFISLFVGTIADLVGIVAPAIVMVIELFSALAPAIFPIISASIRLVKVIAGGVIKIFGVLKNIVEQNQGSFQRIGLAIGMVISIVGDLFSAFFSIVTVIVKFLNPILQILIRIVASVVTAFMGIVSAIKGVTLGFSKIADAISKNLLPAFDRFFNKGDDGFDGIMKDGDGFLKIVQGITNALISAAQNVTKFVLKFKEAQLATTMDEEKRLALQADIDAYKQTIQDLEDSKVSLQDLQDEFDSTKAKSDELENTFGDFDAIEFDFDMDAVDEALADVENSQIAFPVEADLTNLEIDQGIVQLRASDDLQQEAEKAQELFGSISNILAIQDVAGALLGVAAQNINGEGVGNGGAGQPITDNSVTNSNNTAVENITINIGSDETVDIENTEASQIIASTFKRISDGMS